MQNEHSIHQWEGTWNFNGRFYPTNYPQAPQKVKSLDSFLFLHNAAKRDKFFKFKANDSSDCHLEVQEQSIICQGQSSGKKDGIVNNGADQI